MGERPIGRLMVGGSGTRRSSNRNSVMLSSGVDHARSENFKTFQTSPNGFNLEGTYQTIPEAPHTSQTPNRPRLKYDLSVQQIVNQ